MAVACFAAPVSDYSEAELKNKRIPTKTVTHIKCGR